MVAPGATGNVANNHYNLYARDVASLKSFGLSAYRFSMAWPRIFPTGASSLGPNAAGVGFYHRLLDALLAAGIEPIVTMYHWDLPQGLLDAAPGREDVKACDSAFKQGWFECRAGADGQPVPSGLKSQIVHEFGAYAAFLLKEYGHKVRRWVTFNEAWTFTYLGSGGGKAPSVHPYMDGSVWPYVAGHNVILAHLSAVRTFRAMQASGALTSDHQIGITNNMDWREPYDVNSPLDVAAAHSMLEGQLGWFADPIYGHGGAHDYPDSMKRLLPYMPSFSSDEQALLAANVPDFFGLNHYGTGFARADSETGGASVIEDGIVQGQSTWLFGAGWGFRQLLNYVAKRYPRYPIYCTEGGWSVGATNALEAKYDPGRVMYYHAYLTEAWKAIHLDGVDLRGYMAWSLMDNFEWEKGYLERFGTQFADLQPGADPNSPGADARIYDAPTGKLGDKCGVRCLLTATPSAAGAPAQTRHAKNSLLWLQWLWRSTELPDPSRFLASTIGGDVCYGPSGAPYDVSNQHSVCGNASTVPGPPP